MRMLTENQRRSLKDMRALLSAHNETAARDGHGVLAYLLELARVEANDLLRLDNNRGR